MKLIQANWNPAPRQLRQFAATCLIVAPLLGWLWGAPSDVLFGLAVAGLIVMVLLAYSLAKPARQLVAMLDDIAKGEGDLTKRLAADRADELGDISM